jgi:hypothetical protein
MPPKKKSEDKYKVIYETIFNECSINIKYIPMKYISYYMCKKTVEDNPENIKIIPTIFLTDELCLMAVKHNSENMSVIPMDKLSKEFCAKLYDANHETILYMPLVHMTYEMLSWMFQNCEVPERIYVEISESDHLVWNMIDKMIDEEINIGFGWFHEADYTEKIWIKILESKEGIGSIEDIIKVIPRKYQTDKLLSVYLGYDILKVKNLDLDLQCKGEIIVREAAISKYKEYKSFAYLENIPFCGKEFNDITKNNFKFVILIDENLENNNVHIEEGLVEDIEKFNRKIYDNTKLKYFYGGINFIENNKSNIKAAIKGEDENNWEFIASVTIPDDAIVLLDRTVRYKQFKANKLIIDVITDI